MDLSYPIGKYEHKESLTPRERENAIAQIAATPQGLRDAVAGLSHQQFDTRYRPGGWTVRQVVHHIPDSHVNAYIRMKLAVTEDAPAIKAYDEVKWAELPEAKSGPAEMSLALLEALHRRWVTVLRRPPDGTGILFTSTRGGGRQTDIYRYEVVSGATTQVTRTPESEDSPTVTPDGSHISVIRVEADGTQRLWRFALDGGAPELILPGIKPVGYHAWADNSTLALFVLGSPASLQLADASAGTAEVLVRGINRSIQRIPRGG